MNVWSKQIWLLRRAVTVVVALPLLFVVTMVSAGIAGASAFAVTFALGSVFSPSLVWDLSMAVVAAGWAGLYGAVPPTRFVLRIFPWRADQRLRWGVLAGVAIVGVTVLAATAAIVLSPLPHAGRVAGPQATVIGFVVVLVQLVVTLHTYGSRVWRLPGHRIVYLRRFRSFSDRVVYRFLLAALPRGARLLAMVPSHGGARDLDPFTIGFAGMRWREPLAALPRVLVSPDDEWQSHVRNLLKSADSIVVDGSASSASMVFEYDLIESFGLGPRTIVLFDASATTQPPIFTGSTTLPYRSDLRSSLWRGLAWLLLFALYTWLAFAEPFYYPKLGCVCFLFWLPSIFQKSIDRASVRALRHEIERRVGSVPRPPARWLRAVLPSIALGSVPWLALMAAGLYFKPLPADDPRAWQLATAPMGSQTFVLGKQLVDVPVPASFLNPRNILTQFRDEPAAIQALGRRTVGVFLPASLVVRAMFDSRTVKDFEMRLWVAPETEAELMDEAMFDSLREEVAAARTLAAPAGVASMQALGTGKRYLSYAMDVSSPVDRSGLLVAWHGTCTESLVLVRGKPLGMMLCRELTSASDRRWVQAATGHWIDEVLRRNPTLPPMPGNGMGMSGVIELNMSFSLAEANKTVIVRIEEVFPGSPAAAAQLRPGDRIVAIGGTRLTAADELKAAFVHLLSGDHLTLTVEREHESVSVQLVKP
jgi:PDZ domain